MREPRPCLAAALAGGLAACGQVEGRTAWEEAMHAESAQARPARAAEDAFPVPPPPFSPGVFPCSRCHEGGAAVEADVRPSMPHALHGGRGIGCGDCHDPEDTGDPKIPAREVCDTCHGEPEKLSSGARLYFTAVTAADGTTSFPRRWKTRDVRPEHQRHAGAGVSCAACHGEMTDARPVRPRAATLMTRCTSCHAEKGRPTVTCEACHSETKGKSAHENVVLHHAEEQRGCLDCHDKEDRDRLRLANGTTIPFEESFRLCGQCHGTQFRDWRIGLHGKRTGSWNGRREYRLCVSCHWPHDPKFQPMAPAPRPARPEEVR